MPIIKILVVLSTIIFGIFLIYLWTRSIFEEPIENFEQRVKQFFLEKLGNNFCDTFYKCLLGTGAAILFCIPVGFIIFIVWLVVKGVYK